MVTTALRRTALYDVHAALGAKLVGFGGFEMPLAYPSGTVAEHLACRGDAVVFDVSHLGTVRVAGPDALGRLQLALCNDLSKVGPGRAQYTQLLNDEGGVLDDIIVWWVNDDRFDVMPNASNTSRVLAAVGGDDVTGGRTVLAVQGPRARERLATIGAEASAVGRFRVAAATVAGRTAMVAGTGYTGEDGVEVAVDNDDAEAVFAALVAAGVVPAGLGARDTLRLEAALPLHGHELSASITPLEAGLGWVVGWDKPAFAGRDALLAQRAAGPARTLRGVVAATRQPPRDGAVVRRGDAVLGTVTSGNFSPVLGRGIALTLLDAADPPAPGDAVELEVRGRPLAARCAALPFVEKHR
ncbi:MAG TPA: glycine cleavage system aminomethyltransferase GcvT [Acidimicrobiales bacterium]|nr:glycine cleavage system aminomethyltransferase GcvT [Acidimicrobiales bacterium]